MHVITKLIIYYKGFNMPGQTLFRGCQNTIVANRVNHGINFWSQVQGQAIVFIPNQLFQENWV